MVDVEAMLRIPQVDRAEKVARVFDSNISHAQGVVSILRKARPSIDALSAAWCHDAVAQNHTTLPQIRKLFPKTTVASIIYGVVGADHGVSWVDRARRTRALISGMSDDALLVKAADVISHIDMALKDQSVFYNRVPNRALFLEDVQHSAQAIVLRWEAHPFRSMLEARVSAIGEAFS